MSGFVLIASFDGQPIDREVFEQAMQRLKHRGMDGQDVLFFEEGAALGHQHFWVVPEEVDERQPLIHPQTQTALVFDGRIDNRDELITALGMDSAEARTQSDACLLLHSYARWGEACFERLLGSFAGALYDRKERRIRLFRDAMGERSLFYHLNDHLLIAASEPHAVLAYPAITDDLDEITLVRWCNMEAPLMGSTMFAAVREMLPAHVLTIDEHGSHLRCYWSPPESPERYPKDVDYPERFRELLTEAVKCRTRSTKPVTMLLSGGYDSASIAAVGALAGIPIRPVIWTFDELTSCDERFLSQPLIDRFGLDPIFVPSDGAWTWRDLPKGASNPNYPEFSPYRLLRQSGYEAAAAAGSRVILCGDNGNEIWSGQYRWLLELMEDDRYAMLISGLWSVLRDAGPKGFIRHGSVRMLGKAVYTRLTGRTTMPWRERADAPRTG